MNPDLRNRLRGSEASMPIDSRNFTVSCFGKCFVPLKAMLPSWIKVVCVDINPSVVTKLVDRGSAQTMGVVTDTGLFVHQLARSLK